MSETTISFVQDLVRQFHDLRNLLEEHQEDNFGELLPHVFLGNVTRYVVSLCLENNTRPDSGNLQQLREILNSFESAYNRGNEEIQELVSVSFLENLPRFGEPGAEIREMVGPCLARQLGEIG